MLNIQNLKPGEEVIMVIKRHWIIYIFLGLNFSIALAISLIALVFFGSFMFTYIGLCVFWMFWLLLLFNKWLDHELDMFAITNNRIIWVEQIWFLNRSLWECNLWQVQDVKSNTKWLLSNLFDFGTLTIQTAWNNVSFQMSYAPHVIQTARRILNVVDDYRDAEAGWSSII